MGPKQKTWKQVRKAAATQRRLVPQAAAFSAVATLSKPNLTVMDHTGGIVRKDGKAPAGIRSRNAKQESRLLELPAAIRNRIYKYVFSGLEVKLPPRSKINRTALYQPPGILLSCRQVLREANPIFYATTIFVIIFTAYYRLGQWAKRIGPARRAWVKEVRVQEHWEVRRNKPETDPEVYLNQCALRAEHWRSKYLKNIGLQEGVVKCELDHPRTQKTVWTSTPQKTAEEMLQAIKDAKSEAVMVQTLED